MPGRKDFKGRLKRTWKYNRANHQQIKLSKLIEPLNTGIYTKVSQLGKNSTNYNSSKKRKIQCTHVEEGKKTKIKYCHKVVFGANRALKKNFT